MGVPDGFTAQCPTCMKAAVTLMDCTVDAQQQTSHGNCSGGSSYRVKQCGHLGVAMPSIPSGISGLLSFAFQANTED